MREKRARSHDKSDPLFDFELTDTNFDEPFVIDVSSVPAETLQALVVRARQLDALDAKQSPVAKQVAEEPSPLPVEKDDPLHPELFVGHHRRMEREERRMQMLERQQLIITASKVRQHREQLLKADWKTYVENIVKIHDRADGNEMKRKRDMALAEIQQFLQKFDEYNARYNHREVKPGDAERKRQQAQQRRAKAAKQKLTKQRKDEARQAEVKLASLPLTLDFRPCAFGYMMPARPFPPREYSLPPLLREEVETYRVAKRVQRRFHLD